MSAAAHDHDHSHHAPERPEVSSPLLWTVCILAIISFLAWMFFHYLASGRVVGRHHGLIHVEAAGEPEPDHIKLMADRSSAVIDQGAVIYGAKCASCHGAQGNSNPSNMNPPPRNFHNDGWKCQLGGGPYALYSVLTHGQNTMPSFPGLTPAQRYAVIHFLRESWVKTANAKNYVDSDAPEVVKEIPPPGVAGHAEVVHDPSSVEIKAPVHALMAGIAQDQDVAVNELMAWIYAAGRSAPSTQVGAVQQLAALASIRPALVAQARAAVIGGDQPRFVTVLAGSDGSGALSPFFALLPENELAALFQLLKGGK